MKEAVKTGITEEGRKMTTRTTETIAKFRMKSHKLLYQLKNKLTWLPILILAACQNNIIYHSYTPVHNTEDTLTYVTDTLQLFLVDEAGNKTGNGLCGLYQCNLPYKAFIPIRTEGSTRTFRIVHIMRDNPLTGISDIVIQLRKLENQ